MSKSCSTLGLTGPFLDSISASVLACDKLSIGFGFSKANIITILWSRKSHFSQWFGWCLSQTPANGNEESLRGISSKTNCLSRDGDVVWWQSSMSGEDQLLATNSPRPVQDNGAVSCNKKALWDWKFPLEWKKGTIHGKYSHKKRPLSPSKHRPQRTQTESSCKTAERWTLNKRSVYSLWVAPL